MLCVRVCEGVRVNGRVLGPKMGPRVIYARIKNVLLLRMSSICTVIYVVGISRHGSNLVAEVVEVHWYSFLRSRARIASLRVGVVAVAAGHADDGVQQPLAAARVAVQLSPELKR